MASAKLIASSSAAASNGDKKELRAYSFISCYSERENHRIGFWQWTAEVTAAHHSLLA